MALILAFLWNFHDEKLLSLWAHIKNICNNILFRFILLSTYSPPPARRSSVCVSGEKRWCFENLWFLARGGLCAFVFCIILHYPMAVRSLWPVISEFSHSYSIQKVKEQQRQQKQQQMGKVKAKSINWRQRKMKNLFELLNQRIAVLQRQRQRVHKYLAS